MKGVRIHTIVRELNNENIDVISYSEQPEVFIQRSLAPAKLKSVQVNKEAKTADVVVMADQVSLAIGRNGQNIRLAGKLTGYEINLIKEGGEEDEYDIELIDFREELGEELYMKLINAKLDTAKEVIEADDETLLAIEGLTKEKIDEIREMMRRDLEEADVDEEEEEEEVKGEATGDATPGAEIMKPDPPTTEDAPTEPAEKKE
jgi:N utilization substance protein A